MRNDMGFAIAIMQPYIFPYIGYWQLIAAVDKFIILDDVNYIKRGWINRNKIRSGRFIIPLQESSQNKLIKDLYIHGDCEDFYKSVRNTYQYAPYFQEVWPLLNIPGTMISNAIYWTINNICKYLEIKTDIVPSSTVYNNKDIKGQQRIAQICIMEQATRYINPINGFDLYDEPMFSQYGIELRFLKTKIQNNLSIIDILMHNSKEQVQKMLTEYELISKTL